MKRIVLFVLMLVSVAAISQPANYLNIRSRYNLIAVKTDSGFHVPGYSTIPNYRGGVWSGAGNIGVDTVNHKFYFYSGGAWRLAGSTNYADSLRRVGLNVQMRKNGSWTTQYTDSVGVGTDTTSLSNRINQKWDINGNTGLTKNNFIGHTDSVPLIMNTNGHRMFFISDTWDTTWSSGRGSMQDILIGSNAGGLQTDTIRGLVAIGDSSLSSFNTHEKWAWEGNVAIGHKAMQYTTTGYGTTSLGWQALRFNTVGFRNNGLGQSAGRNNISGSYNLYVGTFAGEWATSKSGQTIIGVNTGRAGGGENDLFIGFLAGYLSGGSIIGAAITNPGSGYTYANITFSAASPNGRVQPHGYNLSVTATGTAIIDGGQITGITMTEIGRCYSAAETYTVTITGDGTGATAIPIIDFSGYNTYSGTFSGYLNNIGKWNVGVGQQSAYYGNRDTGTTYLGALSYRLPTLTGVLKNATAIGYNSRTSQSNTVILGDTSVKTKVGVGTTQPTAMIDIRTTSDDAIRLDMPSKGAGKVLTSDASGGASWQYDTCTLATFSAGAGLSTDTAAFQTTTIYGSFYNDGNDTLVITKQMAVLQGSSPSITPTVYWNDSLNVTAGAVKLINSPSALTNTATGTAVTSFDNYKIPPGVWVWVATPTVGTKPTYFSLSLIGYKKRI